MTRKVKAEPSGEKAKRVHLPKPPSSEPEPAETHLSPVYKRRVSPKIRNALRLRVEKAMIWAECAERSGISQAALYKAMKQPHVAALFEDMKGKYIQEVEGLEKIHVARALEVARELLDGDGSDAVKARMVEFLRGGRGGNAVNVQINNNLGPAKGYEFVRPGAEVVTIKAASDTQDVDAEGDE